MKPRLLLPLFGLACVGVGGAFALDLVSVARMDPQARAELEQVRAAYRDLTAYEGVVTLTGSGAKSAPPTRLMVRYRRPASASLLRMGPEGTWQVVTDGTRLVAEPMRGALPVSLKTEPVPGSTEAAWKAVQAENTLIAELMGGQGLARNDAGIVSFSAVGRSEVGGIPTRTFSLVRKNPLTGERETVTLEIGKEHRISRATTRRERDGAETVETHMATRVNPSLPDALFIVRANPARFIAGENLSRKRDVKAGSDASGAADAPAVPSARPLLSDRFDFGRISAAVESEVTHEFPLKNTTGKPLTIRSVRGSCGCMSTLIAKDGKPAALREPLVLQPDEEVRITARIALGGLRPGPLTKSVTVSGSTGTIAQFELTGSLQPAITVSPQLADFGEVKAGSDAAVEVTVMLDRRAAPKTAPTLIAPAGTVQAVPVRTTDTEKAENFPTPARLYRYRLTLAPKADLGALNGALTFAPTGDPKADALLRGAPISIAGTVRGAAVSEPELVVMGSVPRLATASRDFHIRCQANIRPTRVSCADPRFSATLQPNGTDGEYAVTVRLTKPTDLGIVRGIVTVQLSNGQRLQVPVSASVVRSDTGGGGDI